MHMKLILHFWQADKNILSNIIWMIIFIITGLQNLHLEFYQPNIDTDAF